MEKQKYLITRTMVYGTETPQIPDGWEETGEFRPPAHGEFCVSVTGGMWHSSGLLGETEPRIILRKKRVRKVVFTQVGERCPRDGEFIELADGRMIRANFDVPVVCLCFTREEVFE